MIISHLTDVEGNIRYFNQWVSRSPYIALKEGALSFPNPQGECKFVFGGDFCDKGSGDLALGNLLLQFKLKYPNDVFLIAGNREIKYRRFSYELTSNIRERLLYNAPPFWRPKTLPRDFLIQCMLAEGFKSVETADIKSYIYNKSIKACQTLYLKWMLTETMGCGSFHRKPTTFEYRRQELATHSKTPLEAISDEAVTQSFIDAVAPEGLVTNYLQHTQIGKIIGDTLFIHGAVTPENRGYVPGKTGRCSNAAEWIAELNAWYALQIEEWVSKPKESHLHPPGHKPLDHYVVANPRSIVTSNWYRNGKICPVPKEVVQFLNESGIYRVVSGHQPFSDFPLILRQPNLDVISGDTSYSDTQAPNDNRGQAIHNLAILQEPDESVVVIDALRKDGSAMQLTLPSRKAVDAGEDIAIGHFTATNRLIRPLNQTTLVSSQVDGFEVNDAPFNAF